MQEHYVYVLSYPDGTPFYVGKGKGKRISDHGTSRGRNAKVNEIIKSLRSDGLDCIRSIAHSGLTEHEAFALENVHRTFSFLRNRCSPQLSYGPDCQNKSPNFVRQSTRKCSFAEKL